jgi:cell division protein FtsB
MATRKLDKEHLEQIQTLQQGYAENANLLGNIAIERYALQQRLTQIETEEQSKLQEIESLKQQESDLIIKLRERYGEGEINIQDGTFTEINV